MSTNGSYNGKLVIICVFIIVLVPAFLRMSFICRSLSLTLFLKNIYLFPYFSERGERMGKEKERNINAREINTDQLPPICTPNQGLNPKPRHVP